MIKRASTVSLTLSLLAVVVVLMLLAQMTTGITGVEILLALVVLAAGAALITWRQSAVRRS